MNVAGRFCKIQMFYRPKLYRAQNNKRLSWPSFQFKFKGVGPEFDGKRARNVSSTHDSRHFFTLVWTRLGQDHSNTRVQNFHRLVAVRKWNKFSESSQRFIENSLSTNDSIQSVLADQISNALFDRNVMYLCIGAFEREALRLTYNINVGIWDRSGRSLVLPKIVRLPPAQCSF